MTRIYTEFSSDLRDEPEIIGEANEYYRGIRHHDRVNGGFIVVKCLLDGSAADVWAGRKIGPWQSTNPEVSKADLYLIGRIRVLPWLKSPKIPIHHPQTNEPGTITVVHEPHVIVNPMFWSMEADQ